MEARDKQEYLKYYNNKLTTANSGTQEQSYAQKKLPNNKVLPHISQEYNFRITNHLLINKIINPKRDKLILQSVAHLQPSQNLHSRHTHSHSPRNKGKIRSLNHLNNRSYGQLSSHKTRTTPHSQNKIRRKVYVNRTIRNPLHGQTISIVQNMPVQETRTHHTTSCLPTREGKRDKQNTKTQSLHSSCFLHPWTACGSGPTILRLTHLSLNTNPPIKPDTLIQIQLIQQASFTKGMGKVMDVKEQKTVRTNPFKYSQLPHINNELSSIKFSLSLRKIGDFVPLRIWQYAGVQPVLVGTIDLPLVAYQSQLNEDEGQVRQRVRWQPKRDNCQLFRKVTEACLQKPLMKVRMHQSQSVVQLKYMIYAKRFKRTREAELPS